MRVRAFPVYAPEGVTVEAAVTEEVAAAQTDAVEAASDAAVEIAEIQADAAVQIAADANDTAVELAEIEAAETDEDDLLWLRGQLEGLLLSHGSLVERLSRMETMIAEQSAMLASLLILIPPPATSTPEPEPELTTVAVEIPEENASVENTPAEKTRPRRRWLA